MDTQTLLTEVSRFLGETPSQVELSFQAPPPAVPEPRIEKTIWGSPAGKKKLAARLVKLIPDHAVYVEPFAGSGAVFFEKTAVAKEVLGDMDEEIATAYKALKTLSASELEALRKKDWVGKESHYRAVLNSSPRGKVEKLYKFLYLSHFSYGKLRGRSFNHNAAGVEATTIKRIETFQERLRPAIVRHAHYAALVKEFDGKDTFFFLDPPYPGHNVDVGEDVFDEVEFRKVLDGIKGKFLVTYGTRGQLDTSGFHVKKILTPRSIRTMRGVEGPKMLPQLLISNYGITEKRLGDGWELEDVAHVVDVGADVSMQLERARVLSSAIAAEPGSAFETVKAAFAQVDVDSAVASSVVAAELLPLAGSLATSLKSAMPDLATALAAASGDLTKLAQPAMARATPPSVVAKNYVPILKTDEERFVLGIVLEPETVDAQKDIYSASEVRDAAHKFMADFQNLGLMHREIVTGRVKILESYVAPAEFTLDGTSVKKGTWLLAVRVTDDALWKEIQTGGLTGFSIGGNAVREQSTVTT